MTVRNQCMENKSKTTKSLFFAICSLYFIVLTGCALIFHGTTDEVSFQTKPSQSEVYINGLYRGDTPLKLELKSNKDYLVEIKKEGFKTFSTEITNSVGVGYIILDIFGGLIPVVIDGATGAWFMLDQDAINVKMKPLKKDSLKTDTKAAEEDDD